MRGKKEKYLFMIIVYTCNLFENNPKPTRRVEDEKKEVDDVDIVSLHVHFIAFETEKRINGKSVICMRRFNFSIFAPIFQIIESIFCFKRKMKF
jgi:hypothetical protein